MEEKIIVYAFEHYHINFVTDDLADVLGVLEEIANNLDTGNGYSESVKIEVSYMSKIEFDELEDFEEEV